MADIEGQIIAIGTSRMLRIRHTGLKFFVEQMAYHRAADDSVSESWSTVAVATGPTARGEAFEWLGRANQEIIKTWGKDNER